MREFYKSKTFLAVLSIIIAIIIWVYVVYEVNPIYETTISDIPVKCINISGLFEDGSLVITGDNDNLLKGDAALSITVRGKRSAISKVSSKNFSCTVDMISVNQSGSFSLKPSIEHDVSGIEIVKSNPYNFKVKAEKMEQRDIDISVKTEGELPSGYTMEDMKVHNDSVKVTGAPSVVDSIKKAEVIFDLDTLKETDSEKSCLIMFYNDRGNAINPDKFKKTIEYSKISFKLFTTKEVSLILVPKYADEVNKNTYGSSVELKIEGGNAEHGGIELKLKLKGTASALEKYSTSKRTVYTEDISVKNIYKDKEFENIKAAPLIGDVKYLEPPSVKVVASVKK